ncbi:hypothetical protein KUW19_01205 [Ferrimonas balearica]|uniref:hypothetical protein n=1 Tax=Ferrimonas balearica TaxID=44012 RepID=UPI001C989CCE|nr:hypothetical protein [Ferrimonas balearica]MBY6105095.1 hypothetical protein [Ferrimonas balearica]
MTKRGSTLLTVLALLLALCGLGLYLGAEVVLNVSLVSLYSTDLGALVEHHHGLVEQVELVGRLISGFGLALGIASWLPNRFLARLPRGRGAARAALFVLLWLVSVPSLKLAVEQLVVSTTPQQKLASVRSLLFREALDRQLLKFDGADTLNRIVADEAQRDLLVAMLPSLALVSSAVDSTIEAQTEAMVVAMMERDQRGHFRDQVFPIYERAWQRYDAEWARYNDAKAKARALRQQLTAPGVMEQTFARLQNGIDQQLASEWLLYQTAFDEVDEFSKPLTAAFLPYFRERTPQFKSSRCDRQCKAQVNADWHQFMLQARAQGFQGMNEIDLAEDEMWFVTTYVFGREIHLQVKFQQARERYLEQRFPFDDDLEQAEFVAEPAMQKVVVEYVRAQGFAVPDSWQRTDFQAIKRALQARAQQQIDQVWLAYQQQSEFKFVDRTMDQAEYARAREVDAMHRQLLGEYYFSGYRRSLSFDALYDRWSDSQENANFVRMLTDAAAEAAFSPGGILYDLGVDAVRLSYIPPVAIVASFSAMLLLLGRFGSVLHRRSRHLGMGYAVVLLALAGVGVVRVATSPTSYANAMKEFGQQTVALSPADLAVATLLGGVIDAERSLLNHLGRPDLEQVSALFSEAAMPPALWQGYQAIDRFDELAYQGLSQLLLLKRDLERGAEAPYDFNLAVVKADERIGFYAGLNYDDEGRLSQVSIPNVLASKEIGFLLDQRWIYRPDPLRDAYLVINSVQSPEGWLDLRDIGKTSLREALERRTLQVMQTSKSPHLKRVHKAYANGHNNLILVQRNRGDLYDCYQLPKLGMANIAQLTTGQAIAGQNKFECRGALF